MKLSTSDEAKGLHVERTPRSRLLSTAALFTGLLLAAVFLGLPACVRDNPIYGPAGQTCDSRLPCPPGYECVRGICLEDEDLGVDLAEDSPADGDGADAAQEETEDEGNAVPSEEELPWLVISREGDSIVITGTQTSQYSHLLFWTAQPDAPPYYETACVGSTLGQRHVFPLPQPAEARHCFFPSVDACVAGTFPAIDHPLFETRYQLRGGLYLASDLECGEGIDPLRPGAIAWRR